MHISTISLHSVAKRESPNPKSVAVLQLTEPRIQVEPGSPVLMPDRQMKVDSPMLHKLAMVAIS